jgi:hypothetical protein
MMPDGSLLRIGMLMIVATGVIQVVAQLVLSHLGAHGEPRAVPSR